MPHKSPQCPKCGGRTKQIAFLEAHPNRSDSFVLRGNAQFKCKHCGYIFVSWEGIKRIGASRTYQKYRSKKGDEKQSNSP